MNLNKNISSKFYINNIIINFLQKEKLYLTKKLIIFKLKLRFFNIKNLNFNLNIIISLKLKNLFVSSMFIFNYYQHYVSVCSKLVSLKSNILMSTSLYLLVSNKYNNYYLYSFISLLYFVLNKYLTINNYYILNKYNNLAVLSKIENKYYLDYKCCVLQGFKKNLVYNVFNVDSIANSFRLKKHFLYDNNIILEKSVLFQRNEISVKSLKLYNEYNIKLYDIDNHIFSNFKSLTLTQSHHNNSTTSMHSNFLINKYFTQALKCWYLKNTLMSLAYNKKLLITILALQSKDFYFLYFILKNRNYYFILKKKINLFDNIFKVIKVWNPKSLKIFQKGSKEKTKINTLQLAARRVAHVLKNNYNIKNNRLVMVFRTSILIKQNLAVLNIFNESGYFKNNFDIETGTSLLELLNKVPHNGLRVKKARRL